MPDPTEPKVVSLNGAPLESDRRKEFVELLTRSFDLYTAKHGEEPDGLYFVLGGLKQTYTPGWCVKGESQGGLTSFRSAAAITVMNDIINPDD